MNPALDNSQPILPDFSSSSPNSTLASGDQNISTSPLSSCSSVVSPSPSPNSSSLPIIRPSSRTRQLPKKFDDFQLNIPPSLQTGSSFSVYFEPVLAYMAQDSL